MKLSKGKIHFKVFSDTADVHSVVSLIKQLELKSIDTTISIPKSFVINDNEIVIVQITRIDSPLIDKILEQRNFIKNKIIFVSDTNNALLFSVLTKLGFFDLYVLPEELYKLIQHLYELIITNKYKTRQPKYLYESQDPFKSNELLGNSSEFLKIINFARKAAAKKDINILILGETGTGKEALAKAIHRFSECHAGPFIDINCSAIPENLLESELFGHEPGAYTGAKTRKLGLFELAEKGSLFLDEIGDLGIGLQTKLLRTIEKKIIRRLGGIHDIPIDTRIISATNQDLNEHIKNKQFRIDLFYRLNTVTLTIPPLRERGKDVLLIAEHYIKEYNKTFNKNVKSIEYEAKSFILKYPWPGNVRELINSIERGVLLSKDKKLRLKDLSNLLSKVASIPRTKDVENVLPHIVRIDVNYTATKIKTLEKLYANEVYKKMNSNKCKTALLLGISRPKLDTLLK